MKLDRMIAVRTHKTVWRDDGLCLKAFDESYSRAAVFGEASNLARVAEEGLSVPELLEVRRLDGHWTIVTEYIHGKTLEQLMSDEPKKRGEYLELFVKTQLEINSKTCPHLVKLRDRIVRKLPATDLEATLRFDLIRRIEAMPQKDRLLHGDLEPSNLILSNDGKILIIDWSRASQGNAEADTAKAWLRFRINEGESAAEEYLRVWCELSGGNEKAVREWIPIIAASEAMDGYEQDRELCHKIAKNYKFHEIG